MLSVGVDYWPNWGWAVTYGEIFRFGACFWLTLRFDLPAAFAWLLGTNVDEVVPICLKRLLWFYPGPRAAPPSDGVNSEVVYSSLFPPFAESFLAAASAALISLAL